MSENDNSGVLLKTFSNWVCTLKASWLECEETAGRVTCIKCKLCIRHENKIKYLKNFNKAFIEGVRGSSIKKDQVVKHAGTESHRRAEGLDKDPLSVNELLQKTAIGKVFLPHSKYI